MKRIEVLFPTVYLPASNVPMPTPLIEITAKVIVKITLYVKSQS